MSYFSWLSLVSTDCVWVVVSSFGWLCPILDDHGIFCVIIAYFCWLCSSLG